MQPSLGQPELSTAAIAMRSLSLLLPVPYSWPYPPADFLAEAGGAHPLNLTPTLRRRRHEEDCCVACFGSPQPHDVCFDLDSKPGAKRQTTQEGKQDCQPLHRGAR